jgi:hypothetical protein
MLKQTKKKKKKNKQTNKQKKSKERKRKRRKTKGGWLLKVRRKLFAVHEMLHCNNKVN